MKDSHLNLDTVTKHINKLQDKENIEKNYGTHKLIEIKKQIHLALSNPDLKSGKKDRYQTSLRLINATLKHQPNPSHPKQSNGIAAMPLQEFTLDKDFMALAESTRQNMEAVTRLKNINQLSDAFDIQELKNIRDGFNILRSALVEELHHDPSGIRVNLTNQKLRLVNDCITRSNKAINMNQRKQAKVKSKAAVQHDPHCEKSYRFLRQFMHIASEHIDASELEKIKQKAHSLLNNPTQAAA